MLYKYTFLNKLLASKLLSSLKKVRFRNKSLVLVYLYLILNIIT